MTNKGTSIEELQMRLDAMIMRGMEIRAMIIADEQQTLCEELRLNPYHDKETGRFTSKNAVDKSGGSGIIKTGYEPTVRIGMQFFANRNIPRMKTSALKKSIVSWKNAIELHKNKILKPKNYYPDWDSLDPRYQAGLVRHWNHEIKTLSQDIREATAELKKRGDL